MKIHTQHIYSNVLKNYGKGTQLTTNWVKVALENRKLLLRINVLTNNFL